MISLSFRTAAQGAYAPHSFHMALPGLNLDVLTVPLEEEKTAVIHELNANTEWRFEVAFDSKIEVKVRSFTWEMRLRFAEATIASIWHRRDLWNRTRSKPRRALYFPGQKSSHLHVAWLSNRSDR